MWTYQAYLALSLAEERMREANRDRLVAESRADRPQSGRSIRRSAAVALASISRAAASATRRLDECVADDLAHRIAPDGLAAGQ